MRKYQKKEPAFISDMLLAAIEQTRRKTADEKVRRWEQEDTIGKEVTNLADIARIESDIDERERITR